MIDSPSIRCTPLKSGEDVYPIVYVDQYDEKNDEWGQIDAWVAEDENNYYLSTAKSLKLYALYGINIPFVVEAFSSYGYSFPAI